MQYPSQLTPLQAWLLGYIDVATLRDRVSSLEEYGRAIVDPAYASTLIHAAHAALDGDPPG